MDTQNPSAPARPQSRTRARNRPHSGVIHDNARHTERFTVIGNHLAQHPELSGLAIGLGVHIQSLPTGAAADIKTLAARFPESPARIAAALRELEAHGYLRRTRERVPGGRIVTRTVSCNRPGHRDQASDAPKPPRRRPDAAPPRKKLPPRPPPPASAPLLLPHPPPDGHRPPVRPPPPGPPPAPLRDRRRTPRARRRRLAGARPHPHRRTPRPGSGPAARGPTPPGSLPRPPPGRPTATPAAVPSPGPTPGRTASAPEL
jgi:hypothetical protein